MTPQIIAECAREGSTHTRVTYEDGGIKLEFGYISLITKTFMPVYFEALWLADFPELEGIYRDGWNWNEFWALVQDAQEVDMDKPMRVYLRRADSTTWLEEILLLSQDT